MCLGSCRKHNEKLELKECVRFVLQGFGDGVNYRGDFCEKIPEASPSSMMDLLPAKAEPFSNIGSTSVIMCLRKG